jgi:hypothetical protein
MAETSEIAEAERRLAAALERIGKGIARIGPAPKGPPEVETLKEELEAEKMANAQLTERLKALRERDTSSLAGMEAKVDRLTQQLDVQGLELMRMRKVTMQLRDTVRALNEAAIQGNTDPHLINKAMQTELEALRALRQTEVAEMDEILAELKPLMGEGAHA